MLCLLKFKLIVKSSDLLGIPIFLILGDETIDGIIVTVNHFKVDLEIQ
jgi:hypothetical protein